MTRYTIFAGLALLVLAPLSAWGESPMCNRNTITVSAACQRELDNDYRQDMQDQLRNIQARQIQQQQAQQWQNQQQQAAREFEYMRQSAPQPYMDQQGHIQMLQPMNHGLWPQ